MTTLETRLEIFSEMVGSVHPVPLWNYDAQGQLISCSDPAATVLDELICAEGIKKRVLDHALTQNLPCLMLDSLSLAWIAVSRRINDVPVNVYMLGPAFTSRTSESVISASIRNSRIEDQWRSQLMAQVLKTPVISHTQFIQLGIMLHRCVNRVNIGIQDIDIIQSDTASLRFEKKSSGQKTHTGYFYEQQLMQAIETGNIHFRHPANPPEVGTLSAGDPLRQAKNEAIVFTTIVVRSALRGGMPEETAYNLSDHYIQMIEEQGNISDIYAIDELVFADFLKRMYQFKMSTGRSREIQNCIAYIQSHITEKIDHGEIAQQLGYSRNHLSAKFKKEMGITLNEYVNQQRIETAKQWLLNSGKSIQDIAEALNFGTVSYFGSKFREIAGVSPSEYRRGSGN